MTHGTMQFTTSCLRVRPSASQMQARQEDGPGDMISQDVVFQLQELLTPDIRGPEVCLCPPATQSYRCEVV